MKFLLAVVLIFLAVSVHAQNKMYIGVQFDVNNYGKINTGSIRPYFDMRISKAYPTYINRFRPIEMHHGYVGAVILTTGILTKSKLLKTTGAVLLVDDAVQHIFRVNTPIHMINDQLWKYSWYRELQNKVN
jgi:hypothetical protein